MTTQQKITQYEVDLIAAVLEDVPTSKIQSEIKLLERNLKAISGLGTAFIVSLPEHRKIRREYQLLIEVLRKRNDPGCPISVTLSNPTRKRQRLRDCGPRRLRVIE